MLNEHGLRQQLSRDHRARLADDARRTRRGTRRRRHLCALLAHLRLERRRSWRAPVTRLPGVER